MLIRAGDISINPRDVAAMSWDRRHYAMGASRSILVIRLNAGDTIRLEHQPGTWAPDPYEVERQIQAALDGEADRLTCRDPDLDRAALDRARGRVLEHYRACMVAGRTELAAEWEALLVASGYGWPDGAKEAGP